MKPADILRIARETHPVCNQFFFIADDAVYWQPEEDLSADDCTRFDPLNSSADTFAVMAWLLNQKRTVIECRAVCCYHSNDIVICDVAHDGTEAGLRRALVEAAKRVVGER